MAAVGFPFWPDMEHLPRILPVLERIDYLEVAPETLWGPGGQPNAYYDIVQTLVQGGLPAVAHGVALDPASADPERRSRWLTRLRRDTRRLGLRWVSDHLGTVHSSGEPVALPLPAPASFDRLRLCLDQLEEATRTPVGIENSAWYAYPGDALEEPAQLAEALGDVHHLVLDLHNLHTNAINLGFDPMRWLERAPLDRVIEIHISGGSWTPAAWRVGRLRLDSHDGAVPDEVWSMLEHILPRCPRLRGATLERLEGPVEDEEISRLLEELDRLASLVRDVGEPLGLPGTPPDGPPRPAELPPHTPAEIATDRALAALIRDPPPAEPGMRIAHQLVVKLRFARLLRGAPSAEAWFEADPASFVEVFRAFHRDFPCQPSPWDEARSWAAFRKLSDPHG